MHYSYVLVSMWNRLFIIFLSKLKYKNYCVKTIIFTDYQIAIYGMKIYILIEKSKETYREKIKRGVRVR